MKGKSYFFSVSEKASTDVTLSKKDRKARKFLAKHLCANDADSDNTIEGSRRAHRVPKAFRPPLAAHPFGRQLINAL